MFFREFEFESGSEEAVEDGAHDEMAGIAEENTISGSPQTPTKPIKIEGRVGRIGDSESGSEEETAFSHQLACSYITGDKLAQSRRVSSMMKARSAGAKLNTGLPGATPIDQTETVTPTASEKDLGFKLK